MTEKALGILDQLDSQSTDETDWFVWGGGETSLAEFFLSRVAGWRGNSEGTYRIPILVR